MRSYFLILFFAAAILTSCEDKKTPSQNSTPESLEVKDPLQKDTVARDNTKVEEVVEAEEEIPKRDGPILVQEELIPFMMKYHKEHDENRVRIKTRFGNIDVELYRDTPLHRANFLFMVNEGYYDGTFFHRVADGFVIQGGNSDNRDTNRKRHKIGDYLVPSEFDAGHKHVRGALSAAKYAEQNVSKASSPYEFFIVQSHRGAHHLDNDHTVFGRVISGMDVVDKINQVDVDESEWPLTNIHIEMEILD